MKSIAVALLGLSAAVGCAGSRVSEAPAYQPVATVDELMDSVIAHAAEIYWQSVSTVIDENGINEIYPTSDEEWEEVWAAAVALAEAGNLLLMPPRAIDAADWRQYAVGLVEVGRDAAAAALARDPEAVLAAGERVYSACLDCHARYVGP